MLIFGMGLVVAILVFCGVGLLSWRSADAFSPSFLVVTYLGLAYVLDPMFIVATRLYGFNDKYAYRFGSGQLADLTYVVILAVVAVIALLFGWGLQKRVKPAFKVARLFETSGPRTLSRWRAAVTIGLAFAITILALFTAFRKQAASVGDALRWIGNKQALYEGRGYLLLLVLSFKASVLLWSADLLRRWTEARARERLLWLAGIVVTIAIDLATGTRSNLMFSNVLVLLLLFHRLRRPVRPLWLSLAVPLAFVVLIGVRVLTRDILFRQYMGRSAIGLIEEKISSVPRTILFEEVQGADAQLLALESPFTPSPLWGRTIIATATLPIPRAIFPDKPRGANAWFTETYFPVRYYTTRVELTASFLTELWANFRILGVLVGFAVLGFLIALVEEFGLRRHGPLLECVYAICVWRFISLVRGDVFDWVVNTVGMIALLALMFVLMSRAEPKLGS